MTDMTLQEMGEYIAAQRGLMVAGWELAFGELTVSVAPGDVVPFITFLRDDTRLQFVCIIDVCGVDWPEREKRFDVVYHLLSPAQNARIRVKTQTDEANPVPSITGVFPGVIDTELVARLTHGDSALERQLLDVEPVQRLGTPEEVAEAVVWLCSDQASFVTGHALVVDGGQLAGG